MKISITLEFCFLGKKKYQKSSKFTYTASKTVFSHSFTISLLTMLSSPSNMGKKCRILWEHDVRHS